MASSDQACSDRIYPILDSGEFELDWHRVAPRVAIHEAAPKEAPKYAQ